MAPFALTVLRRGPWGTGERGGSLVRPKRTGSEFDWGALAGWAVVGDRHGRLQLCRVAEAWRIHLFISFLFLRQVPVLVYVAVSPI